VDKEIFTPSHDTPHDMQDGFAVCTCKGA
jgi:hypothetical protein